MTQHEASRTLVKSAPELWAECSDAASLARHLGQFGEIRITKLEPETAVAWEGEQISGTVQLEPAGWGTKVILTARRPGAMLPAPVEIEAAPPEPSPVEVGPVPEPAPAAEVTVPEPEPIRMQPIARPGSKRRALAWLRDYFGFAPAAGPELELEREPDPPDPDANPGYAPEPTSVQPELTSVQPSRAAVPPQPEVDPGAETPAVMVCEPVDQDAPAADEALSAALDSLGQAHHRPFSRG